MTVQDDSPVGVAPSQGRGSKQLRVAHLSKRVSRPITGARIETATTARRRSNFSSPHHRGADRNTFSATDTLPGTAVAPSQGRGSKLERRDADVASQRSPHHRGADRNSNSGLKAAGGRVAPSQGRGSKLCRRDAHHLRPHVAPSQGRGSKPAMNDRQALPARVAPSQGRGSKPIPNNAMRQPRGVAPSQGRGSKPPTLQRTPSLHRSPHHRGADRNPFGLGQNLKIGASPHHRGADRNLGYAYLSELAQGRPITGARIETLRAEASQSALCVAPSQGRGSKLALGLAIDVVGESPHHRGADRNKDKTCVVSG